MSLSQRDRVRTPIVLKLVSITSLVLLVSAFWIVWQSSSEFVSSSTKRESDNISEQNKIIRRQVEGKLQNLEEKAIVIGRILTRSFPNESDRQSALQLSFPINGDIVALEVKSRRDGKITTARKIASDKYFFDYDLKAEDLESIKKPLPQEAFESAFSGKIDIHNVTLSKPPLLSMVVPIPDDESETISEIVVADIRLDRVQELFSSTDIATNYLVDHLGRVLAHPDEKQALRGSYANSPIVELALTKQISNLQKTFVDPETGNTFLGAFSKIPYGVTVISQIRYDVILKPTEKAKRVSFFVTGIVFFIALFLIIWFAMTMTYPLESLVETTKEIAKGNFEVKAHVKTKDEVGQLANAFNHMVDGLKERDKVKSLFNKFHGTGIANKLITGEMKLGGEQRLATIFFSDIRGFTSFSEKVPPQEVVNMLNEYFKIMVNIIQRNKGVVDKFIGDAIMAVWGAPESYGNDAINALRACIEMRVALADLNEARKNRGAPEIRIGMGVHTGDLIAGTIGSDDRMEYTVIGDSVNLASRIEAATKAYGTDLLISEVTFEHVKERFVIEEAGSVTVKGKEHPLKLYRVTGFYDENGNAISVETAYSSYAAEHADKVKTA